jgi:hypothetical protein
VQDICDIYHATSTDIDLNDVPDECQPPILISAVSRRYHGALPTGADYDIPQGQTEPRGGDMKMAISFDRNFFTTSGASYTLATAQANITVSSGSIIGARTIGGSTLTFTVSGVTDEEPFTATFAAEEESGTEGSYSVCWPMLAGDVKGDAVVDETDEDNLEIEDGQTLDGDNFRCDLDLDGVIEGDDDPAGDDWDIWSDRDTNTVDDCDN